jgi:hypothetical protein
MGGENQFRVDFRNTENNPFMLVLGWDYPSNLVLVLTDPLGSHILALLDSGLPAAVRDFRRGSGSMLTFPFEVWLPQGSAYSIPIDLRNYDYFPPKNLQPVTYSLDAHLDVSRVRFPELSPQAWTGIVSSNTVRVNLSAH